MDKVKEQAEQARVKAVHGVAAGQAKLSAYQTSSGRDELVRQLGEAYFALQRRGGSAEAVDTALAAVEEYDGAAQPEAPPTATDPIPAADIPPPKPSGPFNVDDI